MSLKFAALFFTLVLTAFASEKCLDGKSVFMKLSRSEFEKEELERGEIQKYVFQKDGREGQKILLQNQVPEKGAEKVSLAIEKTKDCKKFRFNEYGSFCIAFPEVPKSSPTKFLSFTSYEARVPFFNILKTA